MTFAPGQTSQEIAIPILRHDFSGSLSFFLSLTDPTGGATLGPSSRATIVIAGTEVPPPPPSIGPPPTMVGAVRRLGFHRQPTRLVLTFTAPLDPARAEDTSNYQVVAPGRDHRFGTRDDRPIPIQSATYDPTAAAVTLEPARRLSFYRPYRLTVNGSTPVGVVGAAGNPLQGRDGQPGTNFVATLRGIDVTPTMGPSGLFRERRGRAMPWPNRATRAARHPARP